MLPYYINFLQDIRNEVVHGSIASKDEANKRIDAQMSLDEKASRSDYVLYNEGEREETFKAMDEILRRLGGNNEKKKEK